MNPLSPQPEAAELARELRERPDALHALNVLNEAANRDDEEPAPPIPEDLRERWKAHFQPKPEPKSESVSFFEWIKAVLFPQSPALRGAWAFAVMLIIAGGAFMIQNGRNDDVVLRGGDSRPAAIMPAIIVVGTPDDHAEFRRRWSGAPALEVAVIADAESRAAKLPDTLVANVPNGEITLWAGSTRVQTVKVEEVTPGKPVSNIVRTLERWAADIQK